MQKELRSLNFSIWVLEQKISRRCCSDVVLHYHTQLKSKDVLGCHALLFHADDTRLTLLGHLNCGIQKNEGFNPPEKKKITNQNKHYVNLTNLIWCFCSANDEKSV